MAAIQHNSRTVLGLVLLVGEETVTSAILSHIPYSIVSKLFSEHVLETADSCSVKLGERGLKIFKRWESVFSFERGVV